MLAWERKNIDHYHKTNIIDVFEFHLKTSNYVQLVTAQTDFQQDQRQTKLT